MKTKGAKVSDLLKLVQQDYIDKKNRSLYQLNRHIEQQLLPKLGNRVANHLRVAHIADYKQARKLEGASEVTINRELAALRRGFTLGLENEVIERMPKIKLYPEPLPREGHYEPEEFWKFYHACRQVGVVKNCDGEVTADIVLFGYYSGWRLQECLQLHKDWIRAKDKLAVLPAEKHKNKRPKIYPLEGRVWDMIERRLAAASPEGYLFHRNGKRIKNIRRICLTVCDIVGINKAHFFHNLRRSCATNLDRAGVEESTGMKITGHRTASVYQNYNQHSVERLRIAVRKVEEIVEISTLENHTNGGETEDEILPQVEHELPALPQMEVVRNVKTINQNPLTVNQNDVHNVPESQSILARIWRKIRS
jgi:integrase